MWSDNGVTILVMFLCQFGQGQDFENYYASDETTSPPSSTIGYEEETDTQDVGDNFEENSTLLSEEITTTEALLIKEEKKISETILRMLEHFQKPNPEGLPGVDIPDPYGVPDMVKTVTFFDRLYLENTNVHGLSKLKLLYVTADFENMKVDSAMRVDKLQVRGIYRYSSILLPRRGPFTVNITGLKFTPQGCIGVEIDGKLRTQDISIDISFDNIVVNFENLGALGDILQSFINNAGNFIFENIEPHILRDTYTKARDEMDKKIEELAGDIEFPNSIAPLDMVLVDARRKVKEMGYDPYKLDDYTDMGMSYASVSLTNTWITGLSTFHRVGDMVSILKNNTVTAYFEIGLQKLEGTTVWEISSAFISLSGTASFSVDYISVKVVIDQSLDARKKPLLKEINLDVGNIQANCDGAGTIDYIIELFVNVLPNLLRYQVLRAIEGPLKSKLQEELNKVDVEKEIKLSLPRIDELANSGYRLSFLRGEKQTTYDEDGFFNF